MKVAESVDREHVNEHRDKEQVGEETYDVATKVFEEVDRAHYDGHEVDAQHDDTR